MNCNDSLPLLPTMTIGCMTNESVEKPQFLSSSHQHFICVNRWGWWVWHEKAATILLWPSRPYDTRIISRTRMYNNVKLEAPSSWPNGEMTHEWQDACLVRKNTFWGRLLSPLSLSQKSVPWTFVRSEELHKNEKKSALIHLHSCSKTGPWLFFIWICQIDDTHGPFLHRSTCTVHKGKMHRWWRIQWWSLTLPCDPMKECCGFPWACHSGHCYWSLRDIRNCTGRCASSHNGDWCSSIHSWGLSSYLRTR